MTVSVPKSATFPGFEVAVAAHAADMKQWRGHMDRVADDERNEVTGINRHVAYQRPVASRLVESCVNENGLADYQIIDDGPTPAQVLAKRKNELLNAVSIAETAAISAVVPPGKMRLLNMRENDIRDADEAAFAAKVKPGILAKMATSVGLSAATDLPTRPQADTDHLEQQADRRRRIDLIQRAAAKMHSDIEDLTIETVDAWKMPAFPTEK